MQRSADVLACNRVSGSPEEVEVLDTWNVDDTMNNVPDDVMDAFLFSSSVTDGRIMCRCVTVCGDAKICTVHAWLTVKPPNKSQARDGPS